MSEDFVSSAAVITSNTGSKGQHEAAESASARPSAPVRLRAFARRRKSLIASVAALAIYTIIALLYFWWPIHTSPSTLAIGSAGPDVGQNYWYLMWWPYALSHGLNPFITYKIWYPFGYNLAWQTSLPGPSLLLYPISSATGIVMAYNILLVASFALTAWTTYILCYHFVRQVWASLIGGYLFGFSGFMVAQGAGHIHLLILFAIPLSIYLYALRREGRIGRTRFMILEALPLLMLFLTSAEIFTFVAIFSYLAIALYWLFAKQERRQTFVLALELTGVFVLCAIVLSPYLYYMAIGYTKGIEHSLDTFSGDVLGFVVPTNLFFFFSNHVGALPLAGGNGSEQDSYLGLPLALIMMIFAVKYWRQPIGKTLALLALIGIAFTLGPKITVAGVQIIKSPMYYIYKLPLIEKSLPIRWAMFVSLVGSIMAAVWIAHDVKRIPSKIILGVAMAIVLVPNIGTAPFVSTPPRPTFFTTSLHEQYIKPNDVVLILPMGFMGSDMAWQQAANFSFTLSAGYGGATPQPDNILPIYYMFYTGDATPYVLKSGNRIVGNTYVYYIEHYLSSHHVNDIVVAEDVYAKWSPYLTFLHVAPLHVGGVWYYAIPPSFLRASLPGQTVPGDSVPRPYFLEATTWNDATHTLDTPRGSTGESAETLADQFPSGNYTVSVTISAHSLTPVATAEVLVNGVQATTLSLSDGTTHAAIQVPTKDSTIQIKIISAGGAAYQIGNTELAKA